MFVQGICEIIANDFPKKMFSENNNQRSNQNNKKILKQSYLNDFLPDIIIV